MSDHRHLLAARALGELGPLPDLPAPILHNFDAGWTAPETYPVELLAGLAREVLVDEPSTLGYQTVRRDPATGEPVYVDHDLPSRLELAHGHTGLRRRVAEWVGRRQDVPGLGEEHVILTSGGTQAIALALAAFVEPGEGVLCEALTFTYALKSMRLHGADTRMVDVDREGMVVDALEEQLHLMRRDGRRPKLVYTIPTFHLPTGTVMPLERRRRLLELAEEFDLIVLEDAIYSDLRYDGPALPPSLLHLDRSGRVLQSHSFSKILATGLRIGWLTGGPDLVEAAAAVREDLGVSQWIARVVEEFVARGHLDPHIEAIRPVYRRKRDLAAGALREQCGDLVDFDLPHGGFFLWVQLADEVDWLHAKLRAHEVGVTVREAERFMLARPVHGSRHFRLGFAHATDTELSRGIELLAQALRASAAARPSA